MNLIFINPNIPKNSIVPFDAKRNRLIFNISAVKMLKEFDDYKFKMATDDENNIYLLKEKNKMLENNYFEIKFVKNNHNKYGYLNLNNISFPENFPYHKILSHKSKFIMENCQCNDLYGFKLTKLENS